LLIATSSVGCHRSLRDNHSNWLRHSTGLVFIVNTVGAIV
jgi:hypothetical protein